MRLHMSYKHLPQDLNNHRGWGLGTSDRFTGDNRFYYPAYNYGAVEQNAMNDYYAGRAEAIEKMNESKGHDAFSISLQVQPGIFIIEGGLLITSSGIVPFYNTHLGTSTMEIAGSFSVGYFRNKKSDGTDLYPEDLNGSFDYGYGSINIGDFSGGLAYSEASGGNSPYSLTEASVSVSANAFRSPVTGGYYHGKTYISDYRIFFIGTQIFVIKVKQ